MKYQFIVAGYVVMPKHFHLLVGEPSERSLSIAMQVLKQRVARKMRLKRLIVNPNQQVLFKDDQPPHFWQPRYHDFNVEQLSFLCGRPFQEW